MSALDEILAKPETFEQAVQVAPVIPEQQLETVFPTPLAAPQETVTVTRPETLEVQPGEGAGFTTAFKSSFVDNPQTQLRILATSRFPDLSQQDALKRFGFVDGKPVFVNEEGNLEEATGGIADLMGSIAAESPEIIGAVAGAFTPMPVVGSALGVTIGESVKQILSGVFLDDPKTVGGVLLEIGKEAALDLTFGFAAKGVTGLINKNAIAKSEKAINPQALQEARERIFQATGIELDIAQVSGIPELKQLKKWASKFPSDAAEIIQASDDIIAGQSEAAIQRLISVMSGGNPTLKSGVQTINAAKAAITAAKIERAAAVSPLYKKAFQDSVQVNVNDTLALIDDLLVDAKGVIASTLTKTRKLFNRAGTDELDDSVRGLHNTKRAIRSMIETKRAGTKILDAETLKHLRDIDDSLTKNLVSQSDDYARATDAFSAKTKQLIEPLVNSPIGVLSKMETKDAGLAAAKIFQGQTVDPATIRIAREAMLKVEKANPEFAGAWDGAVAQWLQGILVKASKELQTGQAVNVAGKFRQAVIGTSVQKAAMKEALGPQSVGMFNNLMDALQKVASTPLGGSDTAFNQLVTEKIGRSRLSLLQSVLSPKKTFLARIEQNFMDETSIRIAEALTNPAKVRELSRLFALRPSVDRAVLITAIVFGPSAVSAGIESQLSVDQLPPLLQQTDQQPRRSVLDELGT